MDKTFEIIWKRVKKGEIGKKWKGMITVKTGGIGGKTGEHG